MVQCLVQVGSLRGLAAVAVARQLPGESQVPKCSAVQYTALYCTALQYSAVQVAELGIPQTLHAEVRAFVGWK
jgi:hypothetical protein